MSYYLFHTEDSGRAIPTTPMFTGPFPTPTAAMEYGLAHFLDRWTLMNIPSAVMADGCCIYAAKPQQS